MKGAGRGPVLGVVAVTFVPDVEEGTGGMDTTGSVTEVQVASMTTGGDGERRERGLVRCRP